MEILKHLTVDETVRHYTSSKMISIYLALGSYLDFENEDGRCNWMEIRREERMEC